MDNVALGSNIKKRYIPVEQDDAVYVYIYIYVYIVLMGSKMPPRLVYLLCEVRWMASLPTIYFPCTIFFGTHIHNISYTILNFIIYFFFWQLFISFLLRFFIDYTLILNWIFLIYCSGLKVGTFYYYIGISNCLFLTI